MGLPGSDKYRVTEKEKTRAETDIDRANSVASTFGMLLALGCDIPPEADSWKFRCPWGVEHSDGGMDKAARYYGATDTAYCFALHGQLTPVKMMAYDEGITYAKAASRILSEHGISHRKQSYQERFAEISQAREQQVVEVDVSYAVEALRTNLNNIPEYRQRQYDTDVQDKMSQCLNVLSHLEEFSLDSMRMWLTKATEAMTRVVREGQQT